MEKAKLDIEGGRRRAKTVIGLLGAVGLVNLIELAALAAMIAASKALVDGDKGAAVDVISYGHLVQGLGIAQFLAFSACTLAYFRWLHLAYKNADRLGNRSALGFTPRGAVISFFIPFVNIVRPHQVLQNLRRASDPSDIEEPHRRLAVTNPGYREPAAIELAPRSWSAPGVPITAWWLVYIGSGFVAAGQKFGEVPTPDSSPTERIAAVISGTRFVQVSLVMQLAAAVLCAMVVNGITRNQAERARRRRARREAKNDG